jgi:hypothetical protein
MKVGAELLPGEFDQVEFGFQEIRLLAVDQRQKLVVLLEAGSRVKRDHRNQALQPGVPGLKTTPRAEAAAAPGVGCVMCVERVMRSRSADAGA